MGQLWAEGPHQMSCIKLPGLVTHVWYLKCFPSYNAYLLDKPHK